MPSLALFTLVLAMPALPGADTAPEAVVMRFLSLARQEQWDAAAAMLTPDAQFGARDVGGPLNVETLPSLAEVYKASCRLRDAVDAGNPMPGRPDVRFVETRWMCPNRDAPATREMKIGFFVQGEKLAGYYIS